MRSKSCTSGSVRRVSHTQLRRAADTHVSVWVFGCEQHCFRSLLHGNWAIAGEQLHRQQTAQGRWKASAQCKMGNPKSSLCDFISSLVGFCNPQIKVSGCIWNVIAVTVQRSAAGFPPWSWTLCWFPVATTLRIHFKPALKEVSCDRKRVPTPDQTHTEKLLCLGRRFSNPALGWESHYGPKNTPVHLYHSWSNRERGQNYWRIAWKSPYQVQPGTGKTCPGCGWWKRWRPQEVFHPFWKGEASAAHQ